MQELPDIDKFLKDLPEEKFFEVISSILKQQMTYGGHLQDKINYWIEKLNLKNKL